MRWVGEHMSYQMSIGFFALGFDSWLIGDGMKLKSTLSKKYSHTNKLFFFE